MRRVGRPVQEEFIGGKIVRRSRTALKRSNRVAKVAIVGVRCIVAELSHGGKRIFSRIRWVERRNWVSHHSRVRECARVEVDDLLQR